ncbi:MAG: 50S ribosomal protein L31 [Candidatus Staskawiczbacteria bacterium RIFCSPHIGHO2_02_FULL_42_22]|uniref:50S ribosomal protein L31 n=1 Tax=Candidatus Staskawiczbacteria bacterium RIFCSPHIGHO2_02_FULL_42_22 TaxID=1802207 RepID=A0A1G2I1W9_9BACT|nr:MAG: 50S ribosomal protein L31 [Candidatus Staskawiczbacteria bacterium RIFCSPHIGHO2_02_FULL_42_22]
MKTDIHPIYFAKASVKCACGNSFIVGSTKEFIETEICAKCHPFYTKKEKVLDSLGRVQKFKDKLAKVQPKKVHHVKSREAGISPEEKLFNMVKKVKAKKETKTI